MFRHILFPTDLSPEAEVALRPLAELAETFSAHVTIMVVVEPAVVGPVLAGVYAQQFELLQGLTDATRERAVEQAPKLLERYLNPEISRSVKVVVGEPAAEILAGARELDTDLICMATHGRSGFKRLLLGSVADRVLRQSPCPVLLVPVTAATRKSERLPAQGNNGRQKILR